jgi:hypothetical protein
VKFVLEFELLSSGPSEGRTGKPRFLRGVETRNARDEQMWAGGAQRVVTVDDAYLTAQAVTVQERLKMAGVRLGAIFNSALMPG